VIIGRRNQMYERAQHKHLKMCHYFLTKRTAKIADRGRALLLAVTVTEHHHWRKPSNSVDLLCVVFAMNVNPMGRQLFVWRIPVVRTASTQPALTPYTPWSHYLNANRRKLHGWCSAVQILSWSNNTHSSSDSAGNSFVVHPFLTPPTAMPMPTESIALTTLVPLVPYLYWTYWTLSPSLLP